MATVAVIVLALMPGAGGAAVEAAPTDGPVQSATRVQGGDTTVARKGRMDADQIALSSARPTSSRSVPGSTGWSTRLDLLPGTQMVALSWDGTRSRSEARLAIRTRAASGTWEQWLEVEADASDASDEGRGRLGSDVIWLGSQGADELDVRVDAGPLVDLQLLRMRYVVGEPEPAPRVAATGDSARAARPTIRPRADWTSSGWVSSNPGCGSGPSIASRLDHAVIHHTASTNSYSRAEVPGVIEGIYRYHTDSLNWCDIAYNFVVDKYGGIWQGRSGDVTKPVIGGHAKGFNTNSVGITLLGQFQPGESPAAADPTTAMLDSTGRLLAWKLALHDLDPRGSVTVTSGGSTKYPAGVKVTLPVVNAHQHSSLTACPGAAVMSEMARLRDLAVFYSGSTPPPPPPDDERWAPFSSVEALVYRQYVDFLRDPGTYDERRWWAEALTAGDTNRNALVVSLMRSTKAQQGPASVIRLYLAYFERPPDHSGLRYWWDVVEGDTGIRGVSAFFAKSAEFVARYGDLSDADFVRLVYSNVLGRAPDADGFGYWVGRLASGLESRGGLMVLFANSAENATKTRVLSEIILAHDVMLQRGISVASLLSWIPVVEASPGALVGQLFASDEYAARFT